MSAIKIYGLKNCDTCRKAKKALEAAGFTVEFQDIRATPLSRQHLATLLDQLGPVLLNQRSTTWRALSETERALPPLDLLSAHPALMKRPVIACNGTHYLGWSATVQAQIMPS